MPALLLLAACECAPSADSDPAPWDSHPPVDTQDSTPGDSAPPVSDIEVAVHDRVSTMLVVSWTQLEGADRAWVEFGLEGEAWMASPQRSVEAGPHSELLLGVPAESEVGFRIVNQVGTELRWTEEQRATTGALPEDLPAPSLTHLDPGLSSGTPFYFGSLGISDRNWYRGPWYLFVMDQQARLVWYWSVPEGRCTMHAQVARGGDHLLFEETTIYQGDRGAGSLMRRLTLDLLRDEVIEASGLGSTFAETEDGSILLDSYSGSPAIVLEELSPDGTRRPIWDCTAWLAAYSDDPTDCDPNETIWVPETDTVLWSMWPVDTVVELDRSSGELLATYGALPGSYAFDPPRAGFDMQHYPHFTADGTLLVSTHIPGTSGQQRAREYEVDREAGTLTEIWSYGEEVPHYAVYAGEAFRLPLGNTLINYGSDGALREVTPDKRTAWQVDWPSTYLLGHLTPLDDLYALTTNP
jgi:hypothetical protein